MKKFFRKLYRPLYWGELFLAAAVLILYVSIMLKFFPDSFATSEHAMELLKTLSYSPATIVQAIFLCGAIFGLLFYASVSLSGALADWILNLFEKRRKGPEAVKDNLIEVYVDDLVFFSVQRMADMAGVSVPVFCDCVLQSLDMDDFIAVREQMDKESSDGTPYID